ncbi:MAG TPA: xanthine dehydrogenase family protein molybdopterin-binding subunit [Actinomycetota bacterium]
MRDGSSGHQHRVLGKPLRRVEDERLLRGVGPYVADLDLEGAAWVTYVRSSEPHARLVAVRTEAAASAPGVLAVVTAADVDLAPLAPAPPVLEQRMARPWLADGVVRFVGEPVAAIVSETREQGVDAAELVEVDYDWLDPVPDVEAADRGEVLLFPEVGSNLAFAVGVGEGEDQEPNAALFDGCEVVVRQRQVIQRLAPCPLEGRAAAAVWGASGDGDAGAAGRAGADGEGDRAGALSTLTFWISTQRPHEVRDLLAGALGMAPSRVRVRVPEVGGGFGAKGNPYPEELLLAWLARRVGRPLRWVETRSESMLGLSHGRAQVQYLELGGRRDGTLLAYRVRVLQDAGAYLRFSAFLPARVRQLACGNYTIPRVEAGGRSLVTSTVPVGPYRGAGRPEATMAIERAIDLFAAEAGLDPVEVRRRNLVSADAFPWTTATGAVYDSGDYQRALDLVLEAGGYQAARAEQARRRERGGPLRLGIGVALYVEVAGGGEHLSEYGAVEVTRDGAAVVRTGSCATGQGHETTWAMIASEQLGIPVERITVLRGDTAEVARGAGTIGSRSTQSGGVAVHRAAVALRERAVELAAGLLEASPEDVVLDRDAGRFHLAGAPTVSRTWAELAAASDRGGSNSRLAAEVDLDDGALTYPSGAYLAVVEVDTDTGQVRLRRLVAVDDAGNILNPLLAEGQLHGSIAQGVAQALYEEFRYDDDANPLSGTLQVYGPPTAADLPAFDLVELETPSPRNDLGVKGLGEAGCIGAPPAVLGAVVDALAPLGVRHLDMPATPERVWQAIRAARRAGPPWA